MNCARSASNGRITKSSCKHHKQITSKGKTTYSLTGRPAPALPRMPLHGRVTAAKLAASIACLAACRSALPDIGSATSSGNLAAASLLASSSASLAAKAALERISRAERRAAAAAEAAASCSEREGLGGSWEGPARA